MIYKHDIQYITDFYTPGSEARQVEPKEQPRKKALPKYVKREQMKIYVDPVALCSVVTAVALIVLMVVSVYQFIGVLEAHEIMENTLTQLRDENAILEHEYHAGYDLDWIEEQALALGMVPVNQVQHVKISVTVPQPEPEPTLWENIVWFFEGLFE